MLKYLLQRLLVHYVTQAATHNTENSLKCLNFGTLMCLKKLFSMHQGKVASVPKPHTMHA